MLQERSLDWMFNKRNKKIFATAVIFSSMLLALVSTVSIATAVTTLESTKMNTNRTIISRPNGNVMITGVTTAGLTLTFKYDTTILGTTLADGSGNYNFSFTIPYEGNYSLQVSGTGESNATILKIASRPTYVTWRMTYRIGSSKETDVYRIGTSSITNNTINDTNVTNVQLSSNLTYGYVCTYDQGEYSNGLLVAFIHSYKSSDLDSVNFTSNTSTNYTIELKQKIEDTKLLLAYTRGTCADPIHSKMNTISTQMLPGKSFASFGLGSPDEFPYEIRAEYSRIEINGTDRFPAGSYRVCTEKIGVSSGNRPIVKVGRC
jgi:hypothetical protein